MPGRHGGGCRGPRMLPCKKRLFFDQSHISCNVQNLPSFQKTRRGRCSRTWLLGRYQIFTRGNISDLIYSWGHGQSGYSWGGITYHWAPTLPGL